ncbi:PEP-CTERM sorting domain-containing protein, partial [Aquabacterium sp.]|uniref:PEP-CTERM sorting domain-containing protein n=1 Tax=Aquabacterium sp. TaxID=1872578 RepID=UPI003B6C0735
TRTVQTASSRDFEFTLTNLGQADMNGLLALNLNVFSSMSLTALRPDVQPPIDLPPIDVPAIPEPSTYALMGLGLVGIVAVARRRRHTA